MLTLVAAIALFVGACSSSPLYAPQVSALDQVEDERPDEEQIAGPEDLDYPHHARAKAAYRQQGGTDPLRALEQSIAWRRGWKNEANTGSITGPPLALVATRAREAGSTSADPATTAALADQADGNDQFATMNRLIGNGKKAAGPICNGC